MTANRSLTLKFVAAHTLDVAAAPATEAERIEHGDPAGAHLRQQLLGLEGVPGHRGRRADAHARGGEQGHWVGGGCSGSGGLGAGDERQPLGGR